jgi:hypothetical protein
MNLITERALRAAILFWDDRFKVHGNEIFREQAEEAVKELEKAGKTGIVRRQ